MFWQRQFTNFKNMIVVEDIEKEKWLQKDIEINERVEKFKTTFEFLKEKLYERKPK